MMDAVIRFHVKLLLCPCQRNRPITVCCARIVGTDMPTLCGVGRQARPTASSTRPSQRQCRRVRHEQPGCHPTIRTVCGQCTGNQHSSQSATVPSHTARRFSS
ncbi:hypothetical protein BLNAU_6072 [Blattamonas nauphoetae]|uniref:Secreted protein n=1 Tax=Blattamonas nauphoetae TaxID=2049346 RepID=A0ABQ9Y5P5_9EUKA|nr:hypothetical protein BLNAU_6072 [Blattamonas nauphoetae]